MKKNSNQAEERRKTKRITVQESFSLYVVIPNKLGMVRLYMRDISKSGLCFRSDMLESFSLGQSLDLRIYTSPAFYLPMAAKVVRIHKDELGLEYIDRNAKSVHAIAKLIEFFELAAEAGEEAKA